MSSTVSNTIFWSIEPFPQEVTHLKLVARALSAFNPQGTFKIKPVSVVSPADLHWPKNLPPQSKVELLRAAKANLTDLIKRLEVRDSLEPEIQFQPERSITLSAQRIATSTAGEKGRLIAISTHARPALKRFLVGSFTETLLEYSQCPLLTVNPRVTIPERFHKLFFATDFTEESHRAFTTCLEMVQNLKPEIIIGHRHLPPLNLLASPSSMLDASYSPTYDFGNVLELEELDREEKEKTADHWLLQARSQGFNARVLIKDQSGPLVDALVDLAKEEGSDLMAIGFRHSSPIGIIDATTRNLVRETELPLLTIPMN